MLKVNDILRTYVYDLNNKTTAWNLSPNAVYTHGEAVKASLRKQFNQYEEDHRIRMSQLSKPVILQLLPLLGYGDTQQIRDFNTRNLFYEGECWESLSFALMYDRFVEHGYAISNNPSVNYKGVGGHPDHVISGNGEMVVLEVKNVNDYYYTRWLEWGLENSRGYLTQLGMYMKVLNATAGYFLLRNSSPKTREEPRYAIIEMFTDNAYFDNFYNRVDRIVESVSSGIVKTLDDAFELALDIDGEEVPEPMVAFINKGETQFLTIPESMKYSCFTDIFYELGHLEGTKKVVVERVRTRAEIKQRLQEVYGDV